MNVTITDRALKGIRAVAEREKIKDVALYLDMVTSCCSMIPLVKVVERQDVGSEAIRDVAGIPIYSCYLIKQILTKEGDITVKIDLARVSDSDELTIRFYREAT